MVDTDLQSAPEVEVTATCSSWVPSSELDDMPLNLTDTQTVLPLTSSEMNQKVKRVKCEACGKSYKREQSMRKHKCKAPLDKTGASGRSQSDTTQPLDLTVCRSDGDTSLMTVDDDVDSDGAFTCVCSRVFEDYEAYVAHVNGCIKSKLTPYKSCDICGKFFFSSSGYLKHKRLHFGAYKLHCNICHKGFFDRTHLRAHTDSMHSKVRRHVCKMCGKSFFWKHHLKRHLGTCDRVKHDTSEVDAHLASVVIHND
ncbi:hypothetical protein LSAT2_020017 [Lamellibrachia satsuma]|nr:hypothetical protein LSAT2_020017 [Lamellibrachia satsuma]